MGDWSIGVMGDWSDGVTHYSTTPPLQHSNTPLLRFLSGCMEMTYRNKNRGYQQLRVWQDAIEYYSLNCRVFKGFQFELRRVGSQAIASADSVHRNIAEGYCRRSLREYLQFLNESLERKQETGDWIDSLIIKESNVAYG